MMVAGLISCNTPSNVPQLDLTMSKALKDNTELKEFVRGAMESANTLARECVKMHAKAKEFTDVDFDSLAPSRQEELVRIDYQYVEMWYNYNVKHTSQTVQLMEYIKDTSIPQEEIAELGKAMAAINVFIQELKDTYGEDLKLDPYPAPVQ